MNFLNKFSKTAMVVVPSMVLALGLAIAPGAMADSGRGSDGDGDFRFEKRFDRDDDFGFRRFNNFRHDPFFSNRINGFNRGFFTNRDFRDFDHDRDFRFEKRVDFDHDDDDDFRVRVRRD